MIEIYCSAYAISRLKATDCGGGRGVAAAVKRERWKVFSKFRAESKCCVKAKETQEAREISCTSARNCSEIMNHLLLGSLLSPATSEAGAFVCQPSAVVRSEASKPFSLSLYPRLKGVPPLTLLPLCLPLGYLSLPPFTACLLSFFFALTRCWLASFFVSRHKLETTVAEQ